MVHTIGDDHRLLVEERLRESVQEVHEGGSVLAGVGVPDCPP